MPKTKPEFSSQLGRALLQLARKTLMEHFGGKMDAEDEARIQSQLKAPQLQMPCGTFVTLKIDGQLRGCIGTLEGCEPLVESVRKQAINAGFNDPRFAPLTPAELERIAIEVSILTPPQPLHYTGADDLIARLRPRVDGVILRKGFRSATFLPQVWDQLPRPEDFLSHLCLKAGLDSKAWRDSHPEIEIYQVQYFEEES